MYFLGGERLIQSEINIDELLLKYSFGDDDDLLSLSCYDTKKQELIFDWRTRELIRIFYLRPVQDKATDTSLRKIKSYIKYCIKKQDPDFFIKVFVKDMLFKIAKMFPYVDSDMHNMYRKVWSLGVRWNMKYVLKDYRWEVYNQSKSEHFSKWQIKINKSLKCINRHGE
jgi:hypothetical protein